MPIKVPDSLPARATLEGENIFVMTEYRAMHQDMRPLNLLILNLMPTKIVPIVHVSEIQVFYGGTGDDHTVVLTVFDLIKCRIEGGEMVGIGVLRHMAGGVQQLHLDLEGGVGQLAQQLSLRDDLGGHQVQN